jgi:hypothetical protein
MADASPGGGGGRDASARREPGSPAAASPALALWPHRRPAVVDAGGGVAPGAADALAAAAAAAHALAEAQLADAFGHADPWPAKLVPPAPGASLQAVLDSVRGLAAELRRAVTERRDALEATTDERERWREEEYRHTCSEALAALGGADERLAAAEAAFGVAADAWEEATALLASLRELL